MALGHTDRGQWALNVLYAGHFSSTVSCIQGIALGLSITL
jgi:hypothetical protein